MKYLAVIPARYASTRFPGKPLADILGKPLIQRVYENVVQSRLFDNVIVATDDERIFRTVKDFGGEAVMTSATHRSGTERCIETVEKLSEKGESYNITVNIQGDEPAVNKHQLAQLLHAFQDDNVQIASLMKKIDDNREVKDPNIVKCVVGNTNKALYFSRSPIPFARNETRHYFKHTGVYAFRTPVLLRLKELPPSPLEQAESLEQLRWLAAEIPIQMVETTYESTGIDTPEDLDRYIKYLKENK